MRPIRYFLLCLLTTSPSLVFGQGPVLTGIGYVDPSIMRVAPGQITTLFVTGLKTVLASSVSAPGLPLPTTLAGISVTLNQSNIAARQVPLVAVQQLPVCNTGGGRASGDLQCGLSDHRHTCPNAARAGHSG